jgi:hypothetical protein
MWPAGSKAHRHGSATMAHPRRSERIRGTLVGSARVVEVLPTGHHEVQPTLAHPLDKAHWQKP